MFKAFVFDMDGVIVDSESQWKKLEHKFLKKELPTWGEQDYENITGLGIVQFYQYLVDRHGLTLGIEEFEEKNREIARQIYKEYVSLTPGFRSFIGELASMDCKIALCSSSPMEWIEIVLERFDLRDFFQVVVSSDHVNGVGKPDPAIYKLVASKLEMNPADCLVVEDSRHGIHAARDAGMTVLGFQPGDNKQSLEDSHGVLFGFENLSPKALFFHLGEIGDEFVSPRKQSLDDFEGQWKGSGIEHEGSPFEGHFVFEKHKQSFFAHFAAQSIDGAESFHEERGLLGVQDSHFRYVLSNTHFEELLTHTLCLAINTSEGAGFLFSYGDPYSSEGFRERVLWARKGEDKLRIQYYWAMGQEEMQARSGLILERI